MYCKHVPMNYTEDEQLPDPSGPLSKSVLPWRPPKVIVNVWKGASSTRLRGLHIVD